MDGEKMLRGVHRTAAALVTLRVTNFLTRSVRSTLRTRESFFGSH